MLLVTTECGRSSVGGVLLCSGDTKKGWALLLKMVEGVRAVLAPLVSKACRLGLPEAVLLPTRLLAPPPAATVTVTGRDRLLEPLTSPVLGPISDTTDRGAVRMAPLMLTARLLATAPGKVTTAGSPLEEEEAEAGVAIDTSVVVLSPSFFFLAWLTAVLLAVAGPFRLLFPPSVVTT